MMLLTDSSLSWPGASLLTNLAASERPLCKSQAFEHLLGTKIFSDRGISLSWLLRETSNLSTQRLLMTTIWGPWYRDILSYLGSENKEPSTPEREVPDRVRYFWLPGAMRLVFISFFHSCQRFLFTLIMALHRAFEFWVQTPVEGPLGAGLLKTCRSNERKKISISWVHCFFQ